MKERREKAKRRRRRIIYNNDGNDIFLSKLSSPDDFLAQRIIPALDTQVDSIFYCTAVTTLYQHDTNIAERWDDLVDTIKSTDADAVTARDNMRMLRAAGTDCLALVVEKCHAADLEIFWTHRINDIHDSFTDEVLSRWKREHPAYLMGRPDDWQTFPPSDPRAWWSSLDFEIPEVRDHLLAITEEVYRRYDVDGIEIDYMRNQTFFRPNLTFHPATPEQLEILTGFQRRVFEAAGREGERRGRPILVAVRVPTTVAACRYVGIDIEQWLQEGLIDLLGVGVGHPAFTQPVKELIDLGHAHDVPVYPILAGTAFQDYEPDRAWSIEYWRGAASNAWHAGADGIYLFNTFPGEPQHPHFTQLGDPQVLEWADKVFRIDTHPVLGEGRAAIVQSQILPVVFSAYGEPRTAVLPVGDDIARAQEQGRLKEVVLRLQLDRPRPFGPSVPDDSMVEVEVRLNGTAIAPWAEEDEWVVCRPRPNLFRQGDNTLEFRAVVPAGMGPIPPWARNPYYITVRSVELTVRYD